MPSADLAKFSENVKAAWSPRDEMVARMGRIRSQKWSVTLPPAIALTVKTQHSSIPFDVATRAIGILTARAPVYQRIPPGEDERTAERSNTVERYCQARLQWDMDYAMAGRDAWVFETDQIANKGAGVVGSIFAPHAWASVPPLFGEDGDYSPKLWRDSAGKPTGERKDVDPVATSKAYVKAVEMYRLGARPPMVHRYMPTEQCYPVFVNDEMMAMIIKRKASILELSACGFDTASLGKGDTDATVEKTFELTEVWTANRCRYFIEKNPLRHKLYGDDGFATGYGWVPFEYRTGLPNSEETEFGPMGMPLLALVESNIVMIDSLETFRYAAIQGFSFPSWQVVRQVAADTMAALAATSAGEPKSYKIEPGMAVDFGGGAKLEALIHPGLNKDFDKAIEDEKAEVRKIIPDVLFGIPASSGYNSAVMTQQARAFFNPMIGAQEHQAKMLAVMDMAHIEERLPGKMYMEYRFRGNELTPSSKVGRVGIEASDIGGYRGIHAEIGRELDRVTMGTWAAGMVDKGLMAEQTAAEICGVTDWEHERKMIDADRFRKNPDYQAMVQADAARDFGLLSESEASAAKARIYMAPDGTPTVMPQTPQGQAMNGAILGGANGNSGQPNMGSSANPAIQQPTAAQPNRMRRRGGAIPGAPQNQGSEKIASFGP